MILLRSEPRVLLPMRKSAWSPSQYVPKDEFGNDTTRVRFVARIRLSDGHVAWQGTFEDREDFDAFLWAHVTGSLRYDRAAWRLPTPAWIPGLYDELVLEFATDVFLTTTGTTLTYTVPVDWSGENIVHCLGGGGSGGRGRAPNSTTQGFGGGGGGGGYGRGSNIGLTPGASVAYGVGTGDAPASGTGTTSGIAGGNTYFGAATYALSPIGGAGGGGGVATTSTTVVGAVGGVAKGEVSYSGGDGGAITSTSVSRIGSGGGGAAGPSGAGIAGTNSDGTATGGTGGGAGDNGSGGAGGTADGGQGGDGLEWSATPYGSGGGGGGRGQASSGAPGNGGNYGAGGGGNAAYSGNTQAGAGRQGLIYISYTPQIGAFFNHAMMGM